LHQAVENSLSKIVEILLYHKADPNIQKSDGDSSLHIACIKGDCAITLLLLNAGANPNLQNNTVHFISLEERHYI